MRIFLSFFSCESFFINENFPNRLIIYAIPLIIARITRINIISHIIYHASFHIHYTLKYYLKQQFTANNPI